MNSLNNDDIIIKDSNSKFKKDQINKDIDKQVNDFLNGVTKDDVMKKLIDNHIINDNDNIDFKIMDYTMADDLENALILTRAKSILNNEPIKGCK